MTPTLNELLETIKDPESILVISNATVECEE